MRLDYVIALLLAVAALAFGAAVMAAPLIWDIPKRHLKLYFWGGLILTIMLLAAASLVAIFGEREAVLISRLRPISVIVMAISGILFVGAFILYILPDKAEKTADQIVNTPALFQDAQVKEARLLQEFFGGKDENGIRTTFGLFPMLRRNIQILQLKIGYINTGKFLEFNYGPFLEGDRSMIASLSVGRWTTSVNGTHVDSDPNEVPFLATTIAYQEAKNKLGLFVNSALLPDDIKSLVKEFDDVLSKDTMLMIQVLNSRMHEDQRYFLEADKEGSPFYGVIVSDYARVFENLKPGADRVMSAINRRWNLY